MTRAIKLGISCGNTLQAGVGARAAALRLLDRSIRFGHCRLAAIRFVMAAEFGAVITPDLVRYCEDAAATCNDASLSQSFAAALKGLFTVVQPPPLRTEDCQ
ncbi:hypothetical protein C0Z16_30925 [Paraburkholderia rhynchosiae]|uniref:Uncharacterized protein n=1 Tax=Paraburkholderia rhynchosiae TaxID=487049 RepID=A0ABX4UZD5_9BURK|nr:hypothetical protein C0Z16_30925 [Paraburkholderia rhynchosiae]